MDLVALKKLVSKEIEKNETLFEHISTTIWSNPETAFKEIAAHDLLTKLLEEQGFKVERHYILETGFRAEFISSKKNSGYKIAFLCEYDALPGIGHACGHNLIAMAGFAMAVVVKNVMMKMSDWFDGDICVIGTPAEEGGGGKIIMLDGFKDIDAAFILHPVSETGFLNCTTLCSSRLEANFTSQTSGVHSTHFGQELCGTSRPCPTTAMDAAVMAYGCLAILRRNVPSGWRICCVMMPKGINSVTLNISYRTVKGKDMSFLRQQVLDALVAAAAAYNVSMEYTFTREYMDQWPMRCLTERVYKHCPSREVLFLEGLPEDKTDALIFGSSDVGNVSQKIPCIQPLPCVGAGPSVHTKGFTKIAGSEEARLKMLEACEACAITALELLGDEELKNKLRMEFKDRVKLEHDSK